MISHKNLSKIGDGHRFGHVGRFCKSPLDDLQNRPTGLAQIMTVPQKSIIVKKLEDRVWRILQFLLTIFFERLDGFAGGIVAGRAGDAAAGMGSRAAEE